MLFIWVIDLILIILIKVKIMFMMMIYMYIGIEGNFVCIKILNVKIVIIGEKI